MLAAIRIRGMVGKTHQLNSTFARLRLRKKHVCVILPNNAITLGMIKKIKDFITWGEIDQETLSLMIEKRGKLVGDKPSGKMDDQFVKEVLEGKAKFQDKNMKPFFRLHPPKGGFGKGGIKKHIKEKGALGDRGKDMSAFIKKML